MMTNAEILMVAVVAGVVAIGALLSVAAAITVRTRVRERWPELEELAGGFTWSLALTVTITGAIVAGVALAEATGVILR